MSKAYSYARFSSSQQAAGDSLRRQSAARDSFLHRHGLVLSEAMVDAGVSSYRGDHRSSKNDLGRFLELVEAGQVPVGSYLIVESLDRLSREEGNEAMGLLLAIINAGIRVVQLLPSEVIFERPMTLLSMLTAMLELSRGNSESKVKSERVAAAWQQKKAAARATGKAITAVCPPWLRVVDGKYVTVPEIVATVRKCFEWCDAGLGMVAIIARLKQEKHACFARSGCWNQAFLHRLLTSRKAVGELQLLRAGKPDGDPIANYFPAIITEDLYYRAQAGLRQRRRHRGRRGKWELNLFAGLMFNCEDGDAIHCQLVGSEKKRMRSRRLFVNSNFRGKQAAFCSFPADPLERAVLASLTEVPVSAILPTTLPESETDLLETELAEVSTQLQQVEDSLVAGRAVATLTAAATRLEERQRLLRERLAAAKAADAVPVGDSWKQTQTLIKVLDTATDKEDTRLRLQSALRRVVDRVDCLFLRNSRRQLAVVQITFTGDLGQRTVVIWHRGELVNGHGSVPPFLSWETRKATAGADLRNPRHRRLLQQELEQRLTPTGWRQWVEQTAPVLQKRQPPPGRGGRKSTRGRR